MSKIKETHLWFTQGDDEIQVESYCKELNKAILNLHKNEPSAVFIIDDEEPGFLRATVKLTNITFRTIRTLSERTKKSFSDNGRRNQNNLKNKSNI